MKIKTISVNSLDKSKFIRKYYYVSHSFPINFTLYIITTLTTIVPSMQRLEDELKESQSKDQDKK